MIDYRSENYQTLVSYTNLKKTLLNSKEDKETRLHIEIRGVHFATGAIENTVKTPSEEFAAVTVVK